MAPDDEGAECDPPPDVECSHALGAVELVGGDGQEVDGAVLHIELDLARHLHRVHVERNAPSLDDLAGLAHREDHAGLVVGVHHRDQGGVVREGIPELVQVQHAVLVDPQPGNPIALLLQVLSEPQHRGMLHRRGDEVALFRRAFEDPANGGAVPLRAATGEQDLDFVAGAQKSGHLRPGVVEGPPHPASEAVDAGRVAVQLGEIGRHGLVGLRLDTRGCVVVEIDDVGHGV